jgi:hypothetical protein
MYAREQPILNMRNIPISHISEKSRGPHVEGSVEGSFADQTPTKRPGIMLTC